MSEEQNAIGPDVQKPSPITPAAKPLTPGAPRPITVRLRPPVRPAGAAPAATPAAAADAPAPAAAPAPTGPAPAAPVAAAPSPIRPVKIAPAAVRPAVVKPVAVSPAPAAAPSPRATSRISLPEGAAPAPAPAAAPAAAHTPGANPLPAGPKPPSAAQVQAAKSKTSRISLDSAIGVAPVSESSAPKTIKLKRPTDLSAAHTAPKPAINLATAGAHKTSKIDGAAAPADESASVTQKKTLKIKRPSSPAAKADEPELTPIEGADTDPAFQNLAPLNIDAAPKESSVFTAIALVVSVIAAIVMILLTLCLGAHAVGPNAGPNALASLNGPELPWTGRISQ